MSGCFGLRLGALACFSPPFVAPSPYDGVGGGDCRSLVVFPPHATPRDQPSPIPRLTPTSQTGAVGDDHGAAPGDRAGESHVPGHDQDGRADDGCAVWFVSVWACVWRCLGWEGGGWGGVGCLQLVDRPYSNPKSHTTNLNLNKTKQPWTSSCRTFCTSPPPRSAPPSSTGSNVRGGWSGKMRRWTKEGGTPCLCPFLCL